MWCSEKWKAEELVLEDYFKPIFKQSLSKRATALIMRETVVVLGVISVALVYVVENLRPVSQLSMSLPATCVGSLFWVFSINLFNKNFNFKSRLSRKKNE